MRVFVGLDIDAPIRERIAQFMDELRRQAPDVRWVRPESLHVTLKFIGEQPGERVEQIKRTLAEVKGEPFEIEFRGTGFFPNARSPRVFWIGIHAGEQLPALARAVDESLSGIGIEREKNAYKPHLTLARSGSGSPRPRVGGRPDAGMASLAGKLPADAAFGRMTAREFFLYESKLGPGGAKYTKIARCELGA